MSIRLFDAGDTAFTVEFGAVISPALLARVQALDAAIATRQSAGELPGLVECVPTFRSLTLLYDPILTSRANLEAAIAPLLAAEDTPDQDGRHWEFPVCYAPELAPDLDATAQASGLSPEAVIRLHAEPEYVVYMLGFLPGFPFMGDLPTALHLPRRAEPRTRVPAGSVAIATGLTAIYPWESPGGWHLIGRCPLRLFDAARAEPALLAAGDRVRFRPVGLDEYARLERAAAPPQPVVLPP